MIFESDTDAWEFLAEHGFKEDYFMIKIPTHRKITEDEIDAINYLLNEWDWCTDAIKVL